MCETSTAIAGECSGIIPGPIPFRDPIDAADRIGDWLHQAGISKTPGAGKVLAFAAITRGTDVVQFACEHSVVDGRLTRGEDTVPGEPSLPGLHQSGGHFTWNEPGDVGRPLPLESTTQHAASTKDTAGTGEAAEAVHNNHAGGPSADPPSLAVSPAESKVADVLATNAQLDRIVTLGGRITNGDTGMPYTVGEIAAQIQDIYGCEPNSLSAVQADELIARFNELVTRKSRTVA